MAIVWTKYWQGADDGTVLQAIDLRNIQDDLADVVTTDDVLSIPNQTQGDVLYYNGSIWTRLPAGTDGQSLLTKGLAANPEWGDPTALNISGQATDNLLQYDGADWVAVTPGSVSLGTRQETFYASGTWTCPDGITTAYLTLLGGGGGGGIGGTGWSSGGGGGGGAMVDYPVTVVPSTVYTVTVGAAGASVTSAGQAGGGAGGDSIFDPSGLNIIGEGGNGGGYVLNTSIPGASAGGIGGGYIDGVRDMGIVGHTGGTGTVSTAPPGRVGGGSLYGTGGTYGAGGIHTGEDGTGYGAGGGGSQQTRLSGAGTIGIAIVKW